MLKPVEFLAWCQRLKLYDEAIAVVKNIRSSGPSRRVGGGRDNVTGNYPSQKMGHTVQFESHTVELPLIYQMENDRDVLEYFCQPPPIELNYEGPSGKRVVVRHTPDFFRLCDRDPGWIECKTEEQLRFLAEKSPNRYQLVDGRWECPPGRAYARTFGLSYDLHSSASISAIFVRNAQFLDDYLRTTTPVSTGNQETVLECLARNPAISLHELLQQTKGVVPSDAVYQMIATSIIHIDWNAAPLVEPERVRVFADLETAIQFYATLNDDRPGIGVVDICPGASLSWDGKPWTILNVGNNSISLLGQDKSFAELPILTMESLLREGRLIRIGGGEQLVGHAEVQNRMANARPRDLKIANKRANSVQAYIRPGSDKAIVAPNRTLRRHVSDYRKAQEICGNGYIGLIPEIARQGNRNARFGDDTRLAMSEFIKNDFERGEQPTKYSSWVLLKRSMEQQSLPCPSYWTYCKAVAARPRHEQTVRRKGRRAAYNLTEFYWTLDQQTPRHGDRPFEIGHIDHTELDVEMISHEIGTNLGRPWETILTDAFSRRILARCLSFDPPSYRSCMMVIRECVRRHGRLPQIVVVDGGREFESTYFDQVLARYEVTKKTRPPAKARFGSVCERLFGTTNTQFIHNLQGNTQITKNVRQVTKSNNPKGRAIWDFGTLDDRQADYSYEVYDRLDHPALGQSPREAFNAGLELNGARSHRYILYDTEFLMATAPSTRKGTAKVYPGRGVVINYFQYWAAPFRDPLVENKGVPVRYDPYNMAIAWAFVRGRWVELTCRFYSELLGRSEKEVKIATRKILEQMRQHSRKRMTINANKLAAFLANVGEDEEMLQQRLRDQESRHARDRLGCRQSAVHNDVPNAPKSQITVRAVEEKSPPDIQIYGAL